MCITLFSCIGTLQAGGLGGGKTTAQLSVFTNPGRLPEKNPKWRGNVLHWDTNINKIQTEVLNLSIC